MDEKQDIEAQRREYSRRTLVESNVSDDPIEQFAIWFRNALSSDLPDANAMTLATASADGIPSARTILLKGFDQAGFRFYTNYTSKKGQELTANPHAALCFFWPELERQVRIEGEVEKISRKESGAYFEKRPRLSQLGAWASPQSSEVESREALEQNFEEMKQHFKGQDIPLPDFWGGFLLRPISIEFWQGRPGRLHDRIVYKRKKDDWLISRLSP